MTFKEAYMQCKTFENLDRMVKRDTKFAMVLNPDRLRVIEKAMSETINEKGWEEYVK